MKDNVLILFVKYPEPGCVKTRLAEKIGSEKAAKLYRIFVEAVLTATASSMYRRVVFISGGGGEDAFRSWLGNDLVYVQQTGCDLGMRMRNAFEHVFGEGAEKAVIIGTDCLSVDAKVILEAFKKMDEVSVVIGPSEDGGYYLLGLTRSCSDLFEGIDWSTEKVMDQTAGKLKGRGEDFAVMDKSFDVDTLEDLLRLKQEICSAGSSHYIDIKEVADIISSMKKSDFSIDLNDTKIVSFKELL